MRYAILVARVLLGLVFLVFGANHIVPFIHMPAMPGDAGTFGTILFTHGIFRVVGLLQVIGGILLLVGRFVPLGLVLLGPIIVNILLFTVMIQGGNPVLPLVLVALEAFLIFAYRLAFAGIFSPGPQVVGSPKL